MSEASCHQRTEAVTPLTRAKITERRRRMGAAGSLGKKAVFRGLRGSVWKRKAILEMDGCKKM